MGGGLKSGEGTKLKAQQKRDGKAQWNPSDAEKALFEEMTPQELFKVSTRGGNDLNKLKRWWMGKNPGTDVYDFYHAMQEWQAEANRALYG